MTKIVPIAYDDNKNVIAALDPEDQSYVSSIYPTIKYATSKKDIKRKCKGSSKLYDCIKCNGKLSVVENDPTIARWAFRHEPGILCDSVEITTSNSGESLNHILGKQYLIWFLEDVRKNKIPMLNINTSCKYCDKGKQLRFVSENYNDDIPSHCQKIILHNDFTIASEVEFYEEQDRRKADVMIYRGEKILYIFEILESHKTLKRPDPWCEIKALSIIQKYNNIIPGEALTFQDKRKYNCGCKLSASKTPKEKVILSFNRCISINRNITIPSEWKNTNMPPSLPLTSHHEKIPFVNHMTTLYGKDFDVYFIKREYFPEINIDCDYVGVYFYLKSMNYKTRLNKTFTINDSKILILRKCNPIVRDRYPTDEEIEMFTINHHVFDEERGKYYEKYFNMSPDEYESSPSSFKTIFTLKVEK